MLRFIVWVLMFVVVFLSGMLLGVERSHGPMTVLDAPSVVVQEEVISETETEELEQEIIVADQMVEVEAPVHFTQKTASLLDTGVSQFYEIVVDLLYHISSLFF